MSQMSGGDPNYYGYPQQPTSGPAYGQPTSGPAYGQPTSGPGYGQQPYGQQPYGQQQPYADPNQQMVPYQQQQQQAYAGAYQQPGYGQAQYDALGRPLSDKSKVVAGILGIALGGFGAGRFYTGHTGTAVAQLLVTIFTCGLGHFWGLIDGIMILVNGGTDAQGRVLRDS
jgi:TM2 domain-containing membrane protein YozV